MDPKAVLQVALHPVLSLILFFWLKNLLQVALFLGLFHTIPNCALRMEPRPAHHLTCSGTTGGPGIAAVLALLTPWGVRASHYLHCTGTSALNSSLCASCCGWISLQVFIRRAGWHCFGDVLCFEGGDKLVACREERISKCFLLIVSIDNHSLWKGTAKKGHNSAPSLIYGLSLNGLFNNSICSHNAH